MKKLCCLFLGLLFWGSVSHAQQTTPETLIPHFEGLESRTEITAITNYKDGFVVAGKFTGTESLFSRNILYWDGNEWHPFGPFPDDGIWDMVEFGGDLWVAGLYSLIRDEDGKTIIGPYEYAMRWDGTSWVSSNSGLGGVPRQFAVYNDKLYAIGYLGNVNGTQYYMKVWNGSAWEAMADQPNFLATGMVVHDGKLIVAGEFTKIGSQDILRVASYDGNVWAQVGSGVNSNLTTIESFDGNLYAGRHPNLATPHHQMLRFNGSQWQAIPALPGTPMLMHVHDGNLYVVHRAGESSVFEPDLVGIWDGDNWVYQTPRYDHYINGLISYDGNVLMGGQFTQLQGQWASGLGLFTGGDPEPFDAPEIRNKQAIIYSAASKGGDLVVGGDFIRLGDKLITNIALWDGQDMYALGDGFADPVYHIAIFDNQIFAANEIVNPGEQANYTLKSWDGAKWNILPNLFNGRLEVLYPTDDYLYAGGSFFGVGPDRYLTRWDGNDWQWDLGVPSAMVRSIAEHDGELYVGGAFTQIDGVDVNYIGKFENGSWTNAGAGLNGMVRYIYSIDDSLYISGDFTIPGVNSIYNAFVRDGSSWVRPRGNLNGLITDMDKVGDIVFATGYLAYDGQAGGTLLSRWRDTQWTSIESSLNGIIWKMLYHNGGLWVVGDITYNDGTENRAEAALQYQVLNLPGSFTLTAPFQQAVVDSLTPTYRWTPSENAANYLLQVYDNPEYAHPMLYSDFVEGTRAKPLISLEPGQTYYWRVRARSAAGETSWVNGSFSTSLTAVNIDEDAPGLPHKVTLHPAYPNPFNPSTTVRFDLPNSQDVDLAMYDVLGRRLSTIRSGTLPAGQHSVLLDAGTYATGVYIVRLSTPTSILTQSITLIK